MISAVLHVAIHVTDLERSAQFYGNLLRLTLADRPLSFPGLWYQVGPVQIHLIETNQCSNALAERERWGRNPHIALAVNDLEGIGKQLTAAGYRIQASASGRAAFFVQDPDGNVIELTFLANNVLG
ncbi:VOC family protein [Candidatus Synechococcus calcipolaris]|uniref:VOC family protein n=1 Tax=Candidatus Synechococcus calcipolaris TaxID=1522304 RepID=UPI0030CA12E0